MQSAAARDPTTDLPISRHETQSYFKVGPLGSLKEQ